MYAKCKKRGKLLLFALSFLLLTVPETTWAGNSMISTGPGGHVYQHRHDGSCYRTCGNVIYYRGYYGYTGRGATGYQCSGGCPVCGAGFCIDVPPNFSNQYASITCSGRICVCGYSDGQTWVVGHSYESIKDTDATCTEPEYDHNHCTVCGHETEPFPVGERLGHVWSLEQSAITTRPTPYATGIRTFTCLRDGTHTADMPEPKRLFRLFGNEKRIQKLYCGETLIYDACVGELCLTMPSGTADLPEP